MITKLYILLRKGTRYSMYLTCNSYIHMRSFEVIKCITRLVSSFDFLYFIITHAMLHKERYHIIINVTYIFGWQSCILQKINSTEKESTHAPVTYYNIGEIQVVCCYLIPRTREVRLHILCNWQLLVCYRLKASHKLH